MAKREFTDEEFEEARAVKECGYNRRLSPKAVIGPNLTSALSVREKSSKLLNRLTGRPEFFKKIGSFCYVMIDFFCALCYKEIIQQNVVRFSSLFHAVQLKKLLPVKDPCHTPLVIRPIFFFNFLFFLSIHIL